MTCPFISRNSNEWIHVCANKYRTNPNPTVTYVNEFATHIVILGWESEKASKNTGIIVTTRQYSLSHYGYCPISQNGKDTFCRLGHLTWEKEFSEK